MLSVIETMFHETHVAEVLNLAMLLPLIWWQSCDGGGDDDEPHDAPLHNY